MAEPRGNTLPVGYELDDFRIVEVLGRGGFGITYKAMDERLRRAVAIKEYLPAQFAYRGDDYAVRPREDGDNDREMFAWGLTRFVDEARALAMFRHPNIIAVIRYLEANGTAYLVMEYEEGCDLEAWLRLHPDGVAGDLLLNKILLPLLDGLERVHDKGLLHRDIKPENVFMRRDGTPVLIDFGASRPHGKDAATNLTSLVSVGYSPFEQYGGAGRQGPWSDLYALAGTLYRVIAGQKPPDAIARHQGQELLPAVEVAPAGYSKAFLSAIDRALELDPAARPQSAAEFRAMALGAAPGQGTADPGATILRRDADTVPRARARATRGRRPFWYAVAGFVVLAVAGVVAVQAPWRDSSPGPTGPPAVSDDLQGDGLTEPSAARADEGAPPGPASGDLPLPDNADAGTGKGVDPAPPDEDAILSGLSLANPVRDFRETQISGVLLAYVQNKTQFDACRASGCAELNSLMDRVQKALEGYEWKREPVSGSIRVVNPMRLDSDECPFMVDMEEIIRLGDDERQQTRTYCTRNGFDRELLSASQVER